MGVLLEIDEVEALIASGGKGLVGEKRAMLHFLLRVADTMKALQKQMLRLHREIREANDTRSRTGRPTTLDPMDAARFLTPAQREMLYEGSQRERLAATSKLYDEVNTLRKQLHADANRMKLLISTLLDDPTLPPEVRQRLASYRDAAPADPGPEPVRVPPHVQRAGAEMAAIEAAEAASRGQQPQPQPPAQGLGDLFGPGPGAPPPGQAAPPPAPPGPPPAGLQGLFE